MLHYTQVYIIDGVFNPDCMMNTLAYETNRAIEEGYPNTLSFILFTTSITIICVVCPGINHMSLLSAFVIMLT